MWWEAIPPIVALAAIFKAHEFVGIAWLRGDYRGMTDPRVRPEYGPTERTADMWQDVNERDIHMMVDPYKFKWLDPEWRPMTNIHDDYDPVKQF